MAVPGGTPPFPSYAYNLSQPSQIVLSQAQFNALPGGGWAFTPFPQAATVPSDPGFIDTDTRLQQLLVESRIHTMLMAETFLIADDPQAHLRPDVVSNDSSLAS